MAVPQSSHRKFSFPLRRLPILGTLLASLCGVWAVAGAQQIGPVARQQIADAFRLKTSLTPAEQKMSTSLVLMTRAFTGKPLGSLSKLAPAPSAQGMQIQVEANMTSSLLQDPAMAGIERENGQIPPQVYRDQSARVRVTVAQVLALAARPEVHSLREVAPPHFNAGLVTSQGYVTHGAREVVKSGITGRGVTVGVLSDSASPALVQQNIASGDLPANVTIVPGLDGTDMPGAIDEGESMMEVIHDMAPGARIVFATAGADQNAFAEHVRLLRYTYHCDIIVDDTEFIGEGTFQDDVAARAINEVTANGALFFTTAGNEGSAATGATTYEGDFTDSGVEFQGERLHNFGTVKAPQAFNTLVTPYTFRVGLFWADPLQGATDDYDLFILDPTGSTLKAVSNSPQNGTQRPFELISVDASCGGDSNSGYCPEVGDRVLIGLASGQPRALHLRTLNGAFSIATDGVIWAHSGAQAAVSVGATNWKSGGTAPALFSGFGNPAESFSSVGPRRIFFHQDGTPITPGRYTFATGGLSLLKPDLIAADDVSTRNPQLRRFAGTSASAAHAAGIAALVKSANLSLTSQQIRSILDATALDTMSPGPDLYSGYGIIMAQRAVQAAQATH